MEKKKRDSTKESRLKRLVIPLNFRKIKFTLKTE